MNFRQVILQAEFWDIRVTVSFIVVSGFMAGLVVVYFLHALAYFSAYISMVFMG